MVIKNCLLLNFILFFSLFTHAQNFRGCVFDSLSKEPLPFATIKFGESNNGLIAGIDGKFEFPAFGLDEKKSWIEVSCLGYKTRKCDLSGGIMNIFLVPVGGSINDVVIKPPLDKIKRILNAAIENKKKNNPDKYDWYQCHIYYKMIVDAVLLDSVMNDTTSRNRRRQDFVNNQHLLMSETYSIRTWRQPQHLQEQVIASRFSGLKNPEFTSMVTDVLPFHSYSDYLNLNGKDYHNPVSRGYGRYYKFNLSDEIIQANDTVWVLKFTPRGLNTNELKGVVYINSNGYAIEQLQAKAKDTLLKMDVSIEQQYALTPVDKSFYRWFPVQLNYIIDWQQSRNRNIKFHMKGHSVIDSVSWKKDPEFRFDALHTVKINAGKLDNDTLARLRPNPLDYKEVQTYRVIDSMGQSIHLDRKMSFLSKIPEAKIPVGIFDFDVRRLYSYNYYEKTRLGAGIQTNEKLLKWTSVGGWGGYGFGDSHWKYGYFGELYGDRYKEFVFRFGYTDDLNDPGRVHLNHDLDKNYLDYYLLQRVDETKTFSASIKKKLGYLGIEISAKQQQIQPLYAYVLEYNGTGYSAFTAREGSLSFRYAYAERTAPYFNDYYSLGSRYPVWYGNVTTGNVASGEYKAAYTQALTGVLWHKHINRLGFEHMLLEAGKSWSNNPLPISKLFAGNGYQYQGGSPGFDPQIYTFGGIMTITPYQFYTDQFVSFIFRHDVDWKLYRLNLPGGLLSSVPNICLQYDLLYGTLGNEWSQKLVSINVPYNTYQEAGLLLNDILKIRYLNLYYISFNYGYFYPLDQANVNSTKNGRFVLGLNVEL